MPIVEPTGQKQQRILDRPQNFQDLEYEPEIEAQEPHCSKFKPVDNDPAIHGFSNRNEFGGTLVTLHGKGLNPSPGRPVMRSKGPGWLFHRSQDPFGSIFGKTQSDRPLPSVEAVCTTRAKRLIIVSRNRPVCQTRGKAVHRQWSRSALVAAFACCLTISVAAHATPYTFTLAPGASTVLHGNSETISGSFTFDSSTDTESNVSITLAGPGPQAGVYTTLVQPQNPFTIIVKDPISGNLLELFFLYALQYSLDPITVIFFQTPEEALMGGGETDSRPIGSAVSPTAPAPIPEPSSIGLLCTAFALLIIARGRVRVWRTPYQRSLSPVPKNDSHRPVRTVADSPPGSITDRAERQAFGSHLGCRPCPGAP